MTTKAIVIKPVHACARCGATGAVQMYWVGGKGWLPFCVGGCK